MAVSPSPLEMFERLSDEEKVAVDLIQHDCTDDDPRFAALVPRDGRRGYLRTLAAQLPACRSDAALDSDVAMWAAAHARHVEEMAARDQERARVAALDRDWLLTLPPQVRKSVERQRRRTARRAR